MVKYTYGSKLTHSDYGWYSYDAHGNVTMLTDDTGEVIQRYDYDPYGVELGEEDSTDENPFRYSGQYTDRETGYVYLRARYYDPALGRFLSMDLMMDGANWYIYCAGNPVMFIDPSGFSSISGAFHSSVEYMQWMSNHRDEFYGSSSPSPAPTSSHVGTILNDVALNSTPVVESNERIEAAETLPDSVVDAFTHKKTKLDKNMLNYFTGSYQQGDYKVYDFLEFQSYNDIDMKHYSVYTKTLTADEWKNSELYTNSKLVNSLSCAGIPTLFECASSVFDMNPDAEMAHPMIFGFVKFGDFLCNFVPNDGYAFQYIDNYIANNPGGKLTQYELVMFAKEDIGTIYNGRFYSQDQYTNNRQVKKTLYPY